MTEQPYWFGATANSLKASSWTILLARLFGRRIEGEDLGCKCVGYHWRGKLYLTDFVKPAL
jgi:hypothetical protein